MFQYRQFAGSSKPFILNRIFNTVDSSTTAFGVAKYDPTVPLVVSREFVCQALIFLQGHKPLYANEDVAEYNVTNLNNGFTVLTESQIFPGSVHMGKSYILSDELRPCGAFLFFDFN